MPFNYGGRIGLSTVITTVRYLCRIYITYATKITMFIDDSTLDSDKKTTLKAWLAGIQAACMILEEIQVVYEG